MPAQPNYTAEMTALVVDQYQNGTPIEDISEMVTRSVRSVRSKLVREGVYVAAPKPTAVKRDNGPTKKELSTLTNPKDRGFGPYLYFRGYAMKKVIVIHSKVRTSTLRNRQRR